jgi:ArsR family transcriptional regulator
MTALAATPKVAAVTCCGLATAPVTESDAARLAPMFKALGDPVRLRMASMIAAAPELCVCEITPAFDLSSGTISHHLKVLREAGLVGSERRGTFVHYWIEPEALAALSSLLSVEPAPAGVASTSC